MIRFYNPFSKNQYEYAEPDYLSFGRWVSYFNQVNETLKLKTHIKRVLEIGAGGMITYDLLKRHGLNIIAVDINSELSPDILADLRYLPFENECFDLILCFEVLEHVPYNDLIKCLKGFYRITRKFCILSLPTFGFEFVLTIKFPKLPKVPAFQPFGKNMTLSAIVSPPIHAKRMPMPFHQWEIGRKGFPLRRIKEDIKASGFNIIKNFNAPENPYFTFFVLSKK